MSWVNYSSEHYMEIELTPTNYCKFSLSYPSWFMMLLSFESSFHLRLQHLHLFVFNRRELRRAMSTFLIFCPSHSCVSVLTRTAAWVSVFYKQVKSYLRAFMSLWICFLEFSFIIIVAVAVVIIMVLIVHGLIVSVSLLEVCISLFWSFFLISLPDVVCSLWHEF